MSGLTLGPTTISPSLDGMTSQGRIETMMEWFSLNFEDPAQNTPYDSREGGYQYIWGGPYDATDELQAAFGGDATDEEIEEAASNLESEATEWAPHSNRIVEEDEVSYLPDDAVRMAATERVRAAIEDLDRTFQEFKQDHGGIGHNRPPSVLHDSIAQDIALIEDAIETAREELPKSAPDKAKMLHAADLLQKVLDGAKATGSILSKEVVKEFAKQLAPKITEAIAALMHWASTLF